MGLGYSFFDTVSPYADQSVLELIQHEQENAMKDDCRVGAVTDYLDQVKKDPKVPVSIIELWHCALNEPYEVKPGRKDSIEIFQILNSVGGWVQLSSVLQINWGKQKVYRKEQPYYPF